MTIFENRWLLVVGILVSSTLTYAGCDSSSSDDDEGPVEVAWDYASKGPNLWASLSPDFSLCGSGLAQSPIDISVDLMDDLPNWSFTYVTSPLDMILQDHRIQLNIRPGSSIMVDGIKHSLKYLVFKTPGEHSLQGASRAAEVQFYHESTDGRIAIVAVMVTVGGVNKDISPLLTRLPIVPDKAVVDPAFLVLPLNFLPDRKKYFRYDGSLSEPACTEGVKWIVMQDTIEFADSQIEALNALTSDNSRPIQSLNGRSVVQQ